jgi:uncharacterized protein DUF2569/uncharacterized protein DUF4339
MNGTWYYAEGNTQRGPVSLAELTSALFRTAQQPSSVLVWRPGLETWQPAESIAEVAAALARNAALTGMGGWLILIAFGQVVTPLRLFVEVGHYYATLDHGLFERFPVTLVGEALMNVAVAVLAVTTAVLFFRKSRRFPAFFIGEMVVALLTGPVSMAWVSLVLGVESDQPALDILLPMLTPREITQQILAVIGCAVWIPYVMKSRRVANTFVH